jgi:hypothetical protein
MRWWRDASVLPLDIRPEVARPAGWYRFRAAPGLRALTVPAAGDVRAWADGKPLRGSRVADGRRFELAEPARSAPLVALRIEPPRGAHGGAALEGPVALDCGPGIIRAGDWSKLGALEGYSGGAWYRRTVELMPDQAGGRVELDLGRVVSSAEVRVNGHPAGVRVAPPWRFDLSGKVRPGANRIEVLVYNTLANHYLTIPTRYRGELTSGLLGPVSVAIGPSRVHAAASTNEALTPRERGSD